MDQERANILDQMGAGGVEYIEGPNGAVVRVEPDGSETLLIPPRGMPVNKPRDPAMHQRLLQEYMQQKGAK